MVMAMMKDPFKISLAIGILYAAIVVLGLSIVHLNEPPEPMVTTQTR